MKKIISSAAASLLFISMSSFAQTSAPSATSSSAQSAAPTDAQIAAIVVAANTADINAGKLATSKAKSKEVKQFGQRMITDHTGLNKAAAKLVNKLKVTPEESADSKSMKEAGVENMKKLKGLKDAEFDKAYIDNEVTFHENVLDSLDKTLIPSAKNDELKKLLTTARQSVSDHLEHAKKIQASLK